MRELTHILYFVLALSLACSTPVAWAQNSTEKDVLEWEQEEKDTSPIEKENENYLDSLEYPELLVTPLASRRLLLEAKEEGSQSWKNFAPIILSSLATITAGLQVKGDYPVGASQSEIDGTEWAYKTAMVVGGGWLVTSLYMASSYHPYRRAFLDMRKLPNKTKRDRLTRERMAEEAIHDAALLGRRLVWISSATNLVASLYVMAEGRKETQTYGAVSAALAVAPLFFRTRWERVSELHERYKKRIYGPVASVAPVKTPEGYTWVPQLSWTYQF